METVMYVYMWREPRLDAIKIGYTSDSPQQRMVHYAKEYGLNYEAGSLTSVKMPSGFDGSAIERACHDHAVNVMGMKPITKGGAMQEVFLLNNHTYEQAATQLKIVAQQAMQSVARAYFGAVEFNAEQERSKAEQERLSALRLEAEREADPNRPFVRIPCLTCRGIVKTFLDKVIPPGSIRVCGQCKQPLDMAHPADKDETYDQYEVRRKWEDEAPERHRKWLAEEPERARAMAQRIAEAEGEKRIKKWAVSALWILLASCIALLAFSHKW